MSLFNTLQTGQSGLSVSGTGLAVIGDNIANLNSTGFKRNRATFADAFPNTVGTLGGIQKLGRGAVNARINTEFEQGMLQGTGSALDVAITGVGFFQVQSGNQNYYTRDGSFLLDNEGYMVTAQGMNLQGNNAVDGLLGGQIEDIQLDLGPFSPKATTEITLDSQLYPFQDFDPLAIDYQPIQATLDGLTTTMEEAASLADFSTSITVYDSLGRPHDVVLNFEQVAEDPVTQQTTWIYSAIVDAGETELPGGGSGTVRLPGGRVRAAQACECQGSCGSRACRRCVRNRRGTVAPPCDARHEVQTTLSVPSQGLPPRWRPKRNNLC